jgi:hypothetical protein
VVLRHEPGGWWTATVARPRIDTAGRSLAQARRHVRLMLEQERGWSGAPLEVDLRLPGGAQRALDAARGARAALDQAAEAERRATAAAVRALLAAKFSVRDAGELLGLSPTRVRQIAEEAGP